MKTRRMLCGLVAWAVLVVAVSPADALVMVLDEESCTFSSGWSYTSAGNVGLYGVRGDERYASVTTATATWTPGLTGTHDLQVHWLAWPSHSTTATYTVNHASGSTAVTVNQRQVASQGNPGSLQGPTSGDGWGSGWYTLGQFELDASSTVVLSNAPGEGPLSADALRISDEGIIIDEYSANATYYTASTPGWYHPRAFVSNNDDESTQYTHRWGGTDTATYTPGITGPAEIKLSWPAHSAHASAARYAITDASGVVYTVNINETKYADQVTSPATTTQPDWSGWYNAGSFNLGPASTVVLTNAGGAALGADALHVKQLSGYPAEVVKSSAVGYWRLGDPAGATTAVNHGTAGAPLDGTYSPAKVSAPGLLVLDPDTAAQFNGTSSRVAGANIAATGVFSGDWTIEALFVRDAVTAWAGIFSNNGTAAATGSAPLMTFVSDGNLLGISYAGVSASNVSIDLGTFGSQPTDYLGEKVYAVITKTGSNAAGQNTITVYANVGGTWLTPVTGSTSWTLVPRDFMSIGQHWQHPTSPNLFDGTIDEVAIYGRALTLNEIRVHYANTVPEPATMLLLAGGCLALVRRRRRI